MPINKNNILSALILCGSFLLVICSPVKFTSNDTDSSKTLLVTESILTNGTIKLDHYGIKNLQRLGYAIYQKNGHLYDYFPLGASIASIPFVALANAFGLTMLQSHNKVQIYIASLITLLILIFSIRLARLFLPPFSALVISGLFFFGTSLSSTLATALWSHSFAVLSAFIAIYYSIRTAKYGEMQYWPIISLSLFFAYLCRPTLALLAPFLLLFIFTYSKKSAIKSTGLLAALLGCFVWFSFHEYGQLLPDYYLPQRLSGGNFSMALYANLLSPGRGLLIYSPFIILAWLCFDASKKNLELKKSWLLIGVAWPIMHLIAISRFPIWWASWSYGPRLMTDILPGLFLLTITTWPISIKGVRNKITISLLAFSSLFAVYVNSYQGLFNRYAAVAWNGEPNIDNNPEYVFDWKFPQFIHNKERHEARLLLTAEQGNVQAEGIVGWMYNVGKGVPQDYTEAAKWYRLAAEQGNVHAEGKLGWLYNSGEGVPQDYTEAVKWYRLAAEQGDDQAETNLGAMYVNGQGVHQDYTEAAKWFQLAAEQGNVQAQNYLKELYADGKVDPKNLNSTLYWSEKAGHTQ